MSEENKNSDPFDFDFDALNSDNPPKNSENGSFDLENPFGDGAPLSGSEATVSADNPFLNDSIAEEPSESNLAEEAEQTGEESSVDESTEKKKKGFFGRSSSGKTKPKKEKKEKVVKPKKEKAAKTKEPKDSKPREKTPINGGMVLCIVFSVFLLASLLMFNLAAFLSRGPESTIMQTLCFLGAFNLVGLAAAAVPILFYKFPQERTLPNVMLGIAAVAMLVGVQVLVAEFYSYNFILTP